ncbi:MAG: Xaa-Pro peptidase family protein [bacterium]
MYNERNEKLCAGFAAAGIDALLVTSLPNIMYLTGFTGSTAMILVTPTKRWFITDFRYHTQVAQQVDQSYELVDNTAKNLIRVVLPSIPGQESLSRIGFESTNVSYDMWNMLSADEHHKWVPTKAMVEDLREVKSEAEIELIRNAVLLNEQVWLEVLATLGADTTEADLVAEIEYRARKRGATKTSFDPIVASGANSSKPHARFTQDRIVPGTPLTFDMGMLLNGYCSDMTRTVFFRDCPPQWEKIYNIVKLAKDSANDAVKPGKLGREIDAVARQVITDAGYGDKFGHGLGHGVGLEVHEGPRLAQVAEMQLRVGNILTNEPGIYLPGEGGIRIEDMFVVRADGPENLNTLSTDLKVVG